MSVKLQYQGELDFNNTKGILLKGTLVGDYGVNGVGDLLDRQTCRQGVGDLNFSAREPVKHTQNLSRHSTRRVRIGN